MVKRRTIRITFVVVLILIGLIGGIFWQNRPLGWSTEKQLTHGSGDSRLVDLQIDPAGHILHLAWEDTRDNTTDVYYKRSPDDGGTWGPDIRLSNLTPETDEPEPRIGTDGRNVLVFFSNKTSTGEHIFYVSSADGGIDFSSPLQLTNDSGDQSAAAVALNGHTVHLVYRDLLSNGDERLFYVRSPDAGLTWQQKVALTSTPGAQDRYAAIATSGDNVFVTWSRFYLFQEAIYVRTSPDSGASWKTEIQISDYEPPSYQQFPDIASDGAQVHIVWASNGILYSRSNDSGSTWSNPISIINAASTPIPGTNPLSSRPSNHDPTRQYFAPRLAVLNSIVQVVAAGILTTGSPPRITIDSQIYYVNSPNGGETWIQPFSLTTHKPGLLSLAPVIQSYGDASFVAWEDNRNGRLAIFYLSKPDFVRLLNFESQLFTSIAVSLGVAIVVYASLELQMRRIRHRRVTRRRRPNPRTRKPRRYIKTERK